MVIVKLFEQLVKLVDIIILGSCLVDSLSYFVKEVFGFSFVQITILILVMLRPNIIEGFLPSGFVVFEVVR